VLALGKWPEDPYSAWRRDEESADTDPFPGMVKLHLDILVDPEKREFGVEAQYCKPQVAYVSYSQQVRN